MKFYQSKLLNKYANLTHTFTCKQSKNLAFHVNDIYSHVVQNHKELAQELGYDYKRLVHMNQIHSNIVKRVTTNDNFFHPPTCDALITNRKNTPLMVMVADCSAILFFDPKQQVISVAHAGRAGAFSNITSCVIERFVQDFASNPNDILVSIGPAICQNCYEVNETIYNEAKELHLEYAIKKSNEKYFLDIRQILYNQLHVIGIEEQNIEISDICNHCQSDIFYSYRNEKNGGRYAGLISL
ncbi:MAG TPA: peptidoglycan editing factor PgeF [Sulfurimonas autotrophica]|nr:peptidoglycan editing factor PgeF [Sulfurimonas autotrophica]